MKTLGFLFSIILLASLWNCNHKSVSVEETAILAMMERFPQLQRNDTGTQTDLYKLQRTVIVKDKNIKLQLYSMDRREENPQSIITIKNPEGLCAAIPLLSNIHHDYWNFEFDEPIPGVEKTNTTFENEYNTTIDKLNLNRDGLSPAIFEEIIASLLHCRQVAESDSIDISSDISTTNVPPNIPQEDYDSCSIRTRKNYEDMIKNMRIGENTFCSNSYWDKKNNRIYQWINLWNMDRSSSRFYIKLKNYRQDCTFHMFTL